MTKPVGGFFQSAQPVANQIVTTASQGAAWLDRNVQHLTWNLPQNIAPAAQLALSVAPFVVIATLLPRKLVLFTLSVAATIGFLAISWSLNKTAT